mmetsp:Transcript_31361/g.82196  ORF Transcript_31361/g.82196 Transcript_31361/m.82196 type:complete len:97 (+) Transcript_31361:4131-4421(+)
MASLSIVYISYRVLVAKTKTEESLALFLTLMCIGQACCAVRVPKEEKMMKAIDPLEQIPWRQKLSAGHGEWQARGSEERGFACMLGGNGTNKAAVS